MEPPFSLLMVDDDPSVRALLGLVFADTGYITCMAGSAGRALELAQQQTFDAALLDLDLPGMQGLELLSELRKRYPGILMSVLTGRGSVEAAVTAMQNGAVDFMQKPISSEALRLCVGEELSEDVLPLLEAYH